jgi:hypothetical protein
MNFYGELVAEFFKFRILERRKKERGQDGDIDMNDILDNFQTQEGQRSCSGARAGALYSPQ